MIMKDLITASERVSIASTLLIDYSGYECTGCGTLSDDLALSDGWTDDHFDENSVTTLCRHWYCHIDCFRDSR